MNDSAIRRSLHKKILHRHHKSNHSLVVNELGLKHGHCRADVAVVNGRLTGYEIKSEEDSLNRLKRQVAAYNKVFDRISLVVTEKHKSAALRRLPRWWGVVVCTQGARGAIHFTTLRIAKQNHLIDPVSVAQLLWKSEVVELLRNLGEAPKHLRKKRATLYQRLADQLTLAELGREVRDRLRSRKNWRGR